MYYIFQNNKLKPISKDAAQIIESSSAYIVSNDISEMISIASMENSAYLMHPKNSWDIFKYSMFQLKNCTLKEFKTIIYAGKKNHLFRLLKLFSNITLGKYKIIIYSRWS